MECGAVWLPVDEERWRAYHGGDDLDEPACTVGATVYRREQMKNARGAARVCPKARVTGVAFFDYKHGQTGVAPNAIELHPVLDFACLSP